MRDPKRIALILNKIEKIWTFYPDLRFGQLVVVIFGSEENMFNIEDNLFEQKLDNFITKHNIPTIGREVSSETGEPTEQP